MRDMFSKESQKQLKAEYRELLKDVWKDDRMIKYCSSLADVVFKTEDGFYLEVEKPYIETRFCFGYSDSPYDTEDYDRASEMAHYARTNEDHFRETNLRKLKRAIEYYSDKNNDLWFQNHYISQENNILKCIQSFKHWEEPHDISDTTKYHKVSDKDRELIVDAYKQELERFSKRVETYLKRYGLSKVHSWTYWRDE